MPLSEVKTQISQTLQRQMYNDKLEEIQKAVTPELNDAYFGPETPPAMPAGHASRHAAASWYAARCRQLRRRLHLRL